MLMPSVFGKDLFDDFFDFPFYDDGDLTISAEKGLDEDKEDKSAKYIRKERYAGACERSFYVGEDVEQNDIKGEFKHGILKLTIPKVQPHKEIDTTKYIELD